MTAQRALRELQNRRITYRVASKGTFVHPDAFDLLRGEDMREPIDDPDLRRRVTTYLAERQAITIRFHKARTSEDPRRRPTRPDHPRRQPPARPQVGDV